MEKKRKKFRIGCNFSKKRIIVFAVILCAVVVTLPFFRALERGLKLDPNWYGVHGGLEATFIDVGQGDATFFRLPGGKTLLIDSGDDRVSGSKKNLFGAVKGVLKKENLIDYVVLTHNDRDHFGNMKSVFDEFEVKEFFAPISVIDNIMYADNEVGCQTRFVFAPMSINTGVLGLKIDFLSPRVIESNPDKENENSIVTRIEYLGRSIVVMGDAEEKTEGDLVGSIGRADVLRIGHHGSSTSSSENFLSEVRPNFAVISCGKNNDYGHPTFQVLSYLKACTYPKPQILRTDKNGTIRLYISEKTIKDTAYGIGVHTERGTLTGSWFIVCSGVLVFAFIVTFKIRIKTSRKN